MKKIVLTVEVPDVLDDLVIRKHWYDVERI